MPDAEPYLDLYQKDTKGKIAEFSYVSKQDIQDCLLPHMSVIRVFRIHGYLFA